MFPRLRAAWQAWTASASVATASVAAAIPQAWGRMLRGSYEAAAPRDDLWTLADFRDADATLLPHKRMLLRSRSRYEYANNPLVDRVVNVWVNDVVAETGPWPKLSSGDSDVDHFVEQTWMRWWRASNQAGKFRTAVHAQTTDGESVGVLFHNERLLALQAPDAGVSLDVAGFECDRLADPDQSGGNRSNYVDGVHLDPWTREPIAYDILKAHPGSEYFDQLSAKFEAETYLRHEVLHVFRQLRAEQNRGVSPYVSVLPFSGQLRKYFEAEASRAAINASFAVMFKSNAPPDDEEGGSSGGSTSNWWQTVTLWARQAIGCILPDGYEPVQMEAKGAAASVGEFRTQLAGCVAGCFAMPLGRALGNSTNGGYPGMRADLLPYHKAIASDRSQVWEPRYFLPMYQAFVNELKATNRWQELVAEKDAARLDLMNVAWQWPERELVVDPSREDESKRKKLAIGELAREDIVDAPNLDEHDRRCAKGLGLGDDDAAIATFRRLCAKSIHQVQTIEEPDGADKPDDDAQTPPL